MHIQYTNFDGDWDTDCPFCGKCHRSHQVDLGEIDNVRFIHRQPCPQEQRQIVKRELIQVNTTRLIVSVYGVSTYIWKRIPFKEEINILLRMISHVTAGIRGYIYYYFKYVEKK